MSTAARTEVAQNEPLVLEGRGGALVECERELPLGARKLRAEHGEAAGEVMVGHQLRERKVPTAHLLHTAERGSEERRKLASNSGGLLVPFTGSLAS